MESTEQSDGGAVDEAWEELGRKWEDDAAHRRFVAFCSATGSLAEAGGRYRSVIESDPARAERARRQIGAVMAAALLTLEGSREPVKVRGSRLGWVLCGLILAICGYGILSVLRWVSR
jgi:hypothetical protein